MATSLARAQPQPAIAELEAAFAAPSKRPRGAIPRSHLIERLLEPTDASLVAIVAPAGYGKTTILTEWAERDPRPFAWLAWEPHESGRHVLDRVRQAMAEMREPAVIVVDGFDLAGGGGARPLSALIDRLPPGSQLALASRTEPGLPLGRLRAHRRVIELRCKDLAMTRGESAALLVAAGVDLDPREVDTLMRRTEGWPAALYLAALALAEETGAEGVVAGWTGAESAVAGETGAESVVAGETGTESVVAGWTGADRLVADYIRDELLAGCPRGELEFLMRTSVLERLSGPACDAVLGQRDSAARLRKLSRSNLLLFPLDRRDESFRYHPLLAETLRAELRCREPRRERELHRRASRWHADHDDPGRAIDHAIAGRDRARAGELLWRHAARYAARGQNRDLQRWLGGFSEDELATEPALALVAAAANLTEGDGNKLRHWTTVAARSTARTATGRRADRHEAGLRVLMAACGEHGIPAMGSDATTAYGLAPSDSPLRALSRLLEGVAHQLAGDCERARDSLAEGASRGAATIPTVQTLCLAQLALVALDEGDLEQAEAAASRALTQVQLMGLGDYPTEALVFAASAVVRAARGRVEDATRDLRQSQRLLARLTDFAPWYEAEVRLTAARAAFRLSDVPTGRALLAESAPFLRRVTDSPVLQRWLAEVRAQADAASSAGTLAGWVLTTAELRVLQFLPSHLSFPEIADRLCVSPNTIKTHARAVYRKLEATSRAEAVLRARGKGLLDSPAGV